MVLRVVLLGSIRGSGSGNGGSGSTRSNRSRSISSSSSSSSSSSNPTPPGGGVGHLVRHCTEDRAPTGGASFFGETKDLCVGARGEMFRTRLLGEGFQCWWGRMCHARNLNTCMCYPARQ